MDPIELSTFSFGIGFFKIDLKIKINNDFCVTYGLVVKLEPALRGGSREVGNLSSELGPVLLVGSLALRNKYNIKRSDKYLIVPQSSLANGISKLLPELIEPILAEEPHGSCSSRMESITSGANRIVIKEYVISFTWSRNIQSHSTTTGQRDIVPFPSFAQNLSRYVRSHIIFTGIRGNVSVPTFA